MLTFLCAVFLNFKADCADNNCFEQGFFDQDLVDTIKSNTRKALPNFFSCIALSLGSADRLLNAETGNIIGITGASFSFGSAILNFYNWYLDRNSIKGFTHHALNGLSGISSFLSSSLAYTSALSSDPKEKNTYSAAASIFGAFGLFCKGLDLFFTTSPTDDYKCRKGLRNRSEYQELQ